MDRGTFLKNYRNYRINVAPEQGGGEQRTITLERWFLLPLGESDLFLLDSGGWDGTAIVLKVDFETGKCYWKPDESGAKEVFLGTLEQV